MFKVNNKNIRTTSLTSFSSVSFVNFEQVIVSWIMLTSTDANDFKHTIHFLVFSGGSKGDIGKKRDQKGILGRKGLTKKIC